MQRNIIIDVDGYLVRTVILWYCKLAVKSTFKNINYPFFVNVKSLYMQMKTNCSVYLLFRNAVCSTPTIHSSINYQ